MPTLFMIIYLTHVEQKAIKIQVRQAMTDSERQILEARIQLAESRALLADVRSQVLLRPLTALRETLAHRSPEFDAEYLQQLAKTVPVIVPTEDELNLPNKLHSLLNEIQNRGSK
jgi:hypothetical protein